MTRYCFNPKDPTFRYALTKYLLEAGFVECPAPGIPIPPTLMAGPGGVLDQTAAALATTLRKKMGENPTEEQLKVLSEMINGADLKLLKEQKVDRTLNPPLQEPPNTGESPETGEPPLQGLPPNTGAMSEPDQESMVIPPPDERVVDPETGEVTIKEGRTSELREMTSIPLVEIAESADDYTARTFDGPLRSTEKTIILNYGLKKQKVTLDISKTKPQLIKDLQMLEVYDKG